MPEIHPMKKFQAEYFTAAPVLPARPEGGETGPASGPETARFSGPRKRGRG